MWSAYETDIYAYRNTIFKDSICMRARKMRLRSSSKRTNEREVGGEDEK
jgi:hypothetical protein